MKKDYSRRDFVKAMGIGAATLALGATGCVEGKEEMMDLDRLSEYHVFKQHLEEIGDNDYLFIREQRYLDTYMYLFLNVAEDKYLYDNVFITLRDPEEEVTLEDGTNHTKFLPLLKYFDMEDLGNAVDIMAQEYGRKKEYGASEINRAFKKLAEEEKTFEYVKAK